MRNGVQHITIFSKSAVDSVRKNNYPHTQVHSYNRVVGNDGE